VYLPDEWGDYLMKTVLLKEHGPAVVYAVLVQLSNLCYGRFAMVLTRFEAHPSAQSHENHLIIKLFLFQVPLSCPPRFLLHWERS
jgi:hypothetical protein